jgi:hypothetical protein
MTMEIKKEISKDNTVPLIPDETSDVTMKCQLSSLLLDMWQLMVILKKGFCVLQM